MLLSVTLGVKVVATGSSTRLTESFVLATRDSALLQLDSV